MWPRRILLLAGLVALCGTWSVSAHAETIQVVIDKVAYMPTNITAKVGDTIAWMNKDPFTHTATGRKGEWKVVIPPNKTARIVLKKAGTVEYYCELHPNMIGHVTVAPKPKPTPSPAPSH